MSKLFLVIYITGQVGGSVGPLPYDMRECLRRRLDLLNVKADPTLWTFIHHGIEQTRDGKTVRLICEELPDHPKITFGGRP